MNRWPGDVIIEVVGTEYVFKIYDERIAVDRLSFSTALLGIQFVQRVELCDGYALVTAAFNGLPPREALNVIALACSDAVAAQL